MNDLERTQRVSLDASLTERDSHRLHDSETTLSSAFASTATMAQTSLPTKSGDLGADDQPSGLSAFTVEAMDVADATHTDTFLKLIILMIGVSSIMLLSIGGDPVIKGVTIGGLSVTVGVFVWMLRHIHDKRLYTMRQLTVLSAICLVASYTCVYFWGLFSLAPMIFILCIAFISQSGSMALALTAYLSCAVPQAVLTVLLLSGVLPDRSLIPISTMGMPEVIASQCIVHGMYFCAFISARFGRHASEQAMQRVERAARQVERQEMLLAEARQELNQALRAGAPGRFTGQRLGSFRLGVLLGHGAMGEVYEAFHCDTDKPAAVKLLHRHTVADERVLQRFLREAENAARLDVANVVKVYESGSANDGVPYLAMERLKGQDLAHHLRHRKQLSTGEVVELVRQVGLGLEAARGAGIVHRDIKPQNIFFTELAQGKPLWKILDFGVSKLAQHSGTLTQGHIVGTPAYMAPEQANSEEVDHRTDLFALAAVAYRALTGHPAFSARDLAGILYQVVYKMPEQPSQIIPVPEDVDLVFAIGLAKSRDDRFDSGGEFADALAAAANSQLDEALRVRARTLLFERPWQS